jgi:beta-lactamase class D
MRFFLVFLYSDPFIGKLKYLSPLVSEVKLFHCIILLVFVGCMPQSKTTYEQGEVTVPFNDSIQHVVESAFSARGVDGCFVLYDMQQDTALRYNPERCRQDFLPASTFKIANSLIALECRAVSDIHEIIEWDEISREVPAWNQDQTMETAFRYSAVWFYQEMARRIGQVQMQKWVEKMRYGNMKAGPGDDDFWLVGDLRISADEQIAFLKKIISEDLPVKMKNLKAVKQIMVEERNDRYALRAKTGWATKGTPIGWYVGWLEFEGNTYVFAMNMDIEKEGEQVYRKEITREILDRIFDLDLAL